MTTAAQYRQYANECIDSAREAQTTEERLQFLKLAKIWLTSAESIERLSAPADSTRNNGLHPEPQPYAGNAASPPDDSQNG